MRHTVSLAMPYAGIAILAYGLWNIALAYGLWNVARALHNEMIRRIAGQMQTDIRLTAIGRAWSADETIRADVTQLKSEVHDLQNWRVALSMARKPSRVEGKKDDGSTS